MATACFSQALPLILVLLLCTDAVSVLPAPGNVSVSSFNLQQILQWDPVKVENVTYMVEYRSWYEGDNDYLALCKKTTQTECNFTALVPFNWRIILRVRAEVGNLSSIWRETPKFQATRNTTLGPVKSLKLLPREAVHDAISVSFEPPISREILPHGSVMKFTLHYWKNSSGKEKEISSTNTHILLKDLDPMSVYCVEVTASVWNLVGEPSETVCEKTSAAPALTATGYIWLVVGLVCACCVISVCSLALYKHHKMIKKLLPPPPLTIPYHVEKFLQDTSFQYLKGDQCEIEEHYDHISIVEHGSGYDRKDSCNEEWDLKQMPDEKSFYQTIS
ncbi:interferon gamma receptor 2 [Xenopus laevis]|uniref:Interferon gamma receptor 2 n=2 Tax=Xenopus laevis TaxID=8355 RepID=A0A8J0UJE3_XENLA|nr:interferon gamma receptor 2 [Xenopus laevis]